MQDILIVVDMQNDFIEGALGTEEAEAIVPNVVKKIKSFSGKIVYTQDTHDTNYLETMEGKNLPVPHCIKNTDGWKLHPDIEKLRADSLSIEKHTFGSVELGQFLQETNQQNTVTAVTLIGLCTDICIISNAILVKAFLPDTEVTVDAACCAGVTPESHNRALEAMGKCHIGISGKK